jgi:hypothetical protein
MIKSTTRDLFIEIQRAVFATHKQLSTDSHLYLGMPQFTRRLSHDIPALWSHQEAQVAANAQRRRLSGKARRVLELLIEQQDSTEAYLGAYLGFTDRMLFLLAQAGLVTIRHEVINTGGELIDIGRVRITDTGRRALEDMTTRKASPRLQPGQ